MEILFILIIILVILWYISNRSEPFANNLTIIDPYSLYLFKDISRKEDWWNKTHGRKLYYYRDYTLPVYKE